MSVHIAIEELADAAEGLLDPGRAAVVEAHLAGCSTCAEAAAELADVTELLHSQPAPVMPDDVLARLTRSVAVESERRASTTAQPADPPASGTRRQPRQTLGNFNDRLTPKPRSRFWYRALAACALAAAVGFGGYVASATAGLNEPQAAVPVQVSSTGLVPQLSRLVWDDPDLHLFSSAWRCARQVTDGRISGLREAYVDGRPALLVYQEDDGVRTVTVVTGCASGTPRVVETARLKG
ncbi:hypothetical protein GCM10009841_04410 [Microlunatus panaciterrae]|uniref:Putative zinc-finger domain-containing protein n=1 Tax=Microlunatus panaciterrae TaxID=400768 RepID=A0ABS2RL52_9ACTN|nr:hypothetical protein [Microlunatus panaciterrae]